MGMAAAVLSGFVWALVAPWVERYVRNAAGWILALLPLGLTIYFVSALPLMARQEVLTSSLTWAPSIGLDLAFRLDGLGMLFALLITGIGALIVIYSGGYLAGDPQRGRFFSFLLLFMASMLGLVLADNLLLLYVFWELTSVSSWLLIGFRHQKEESRKAAWQALIVTVAGGLALLAAVVLLSMAGRTFELSVLLERGDSIRSSSLYLPALLLILVAAFTKSAQVPFHFWLPNAMAAPTPVSAYLHSATMVKAGIYLLARLSPVLGATAVWSWLLTGFGTATMVVGVWLAVIQTDLKRVLAYATVSALGMMTLSLGLGEKEAVIAAMMLLLAHAFYKGALFLTSGAVEHESGTRDAEQAHGLGWAMPLTALAALLAMISMAGVPPTLGFLSEEELFKITKEIPTQTIAKIALTTATVGSGVLYVTAAIIAGLRPFFGKRSPTPKEPHEAPFSMWLGALLLAIGGVGLAFLTEPLDRMLITPTISSILGHPAHADLRLWHGFTLPFVFDLVTLVLGVALFFAWRRLRLGISDLRAVSRFGPDRGYHATIRGMLNVADWQTRLLQHGYLPYYATVVVIVTIGLTAYPLFTMEGLHPEIDWSGVRIYDIGLVLLAAASAVGAALATSRVAVIGAMSTVGFIVAIFFTIFGAPDLAIVQFLVETLFVILFVLVLPYLPRFAPLTAGATEVRDGVIAVAVGVLMTVLLLGITTEPPDPSLPQYFAERSYPEGHGRNIVNVILVDFRSLDTLGEITVLSIAALGVYVLLKLRLEK